MHSQTDVGSDEENLQRVERLQRLVTLAEDLHRSSFLLQDPPGYAITKSTGYYTGCKLFAKRYNFRKLFKTVICLGKLSQTVDGITHPV